MGLEYLTVESAGLSKHQSTWLGDFSATDLLLPCQKRNGDQFNPGSSPENSLHLDVLYSVLLPSPFQTMGFIGRPTSTDSISTSETKPLWAQSPTGWTRWYLSGWDSSHQGHSLICQMWPLAFSQSQRSRANSESQSTFQPRPAARLWGRCSGWARSPPRLAPPSRSRCLPMRWVSCSYTTFVKSLSSVQPGFRSRSESWKSLCRLRWDRGSLPGIGTETFGLLGSSF